MKRASSVLLLLLLLKVVNVCHGSSQMFSVYWNSSNPNFRRHPSDDYVMEVNKNNHPWEYDQVNIICPQYKKGSLDVERHIIYSVTKEEFDSCRITSRRPKIVAVCDKPHQLTYFTLTFRSFTPSPRQLEFTPGRSYYFISTANKEDIRRRSGGWCSSHNMRLVFRVAAPRPKKPVVTGHEELADRGVLVDPRHYYRPAHTVSGQLSQQTREASQTSSRRLKKTEREEPGGGLVSRGSALPLTSTNSSVMYRPWVVWSLAVLLWSLL